MLAALVSQGGYRPAVEVVEAPTDQRETLGHEVLHRGREIELPLKPRFDRMGVRRRHIKLVGGQHLRADMTGYQFLGQEHIGGTNGERTQEPPTPGSDQRQRSRDSEKTSGTHARDAIRAARPTQGRLNARRQTRRRLKIKGAVLDRDPDRLKTRVGLRTRRARFEVLFNLQALDQIELAVDITVDERLCLWAPQVTTPSPLGYPSRSRSRSRARARRDMTVPMGIPAMAAISL